MEEEAGKVTELHLQYATAAASVKALESRLESERRKERQLAQELGRHPPDGESR